MLPMILYTATAQITHGKGETETLRTRTLNMCKQQQKPHQEHLSADRYQPHNTRTLD